MPTQIQLRRDTAADWTSNNPTMAAGEFGWESDPNVDIESKYQTVRQSLKNNFAKVFCLKNFEDSWTYVADILKIDREPRLSTNRSNEDYKKYADRKNLSQEFIEWHRVYNMYDYKLYKEFCA